MLCNKLTKLKLIFTAASNSTPTTEFLSGEVAQIKVVNNFGKIISLLSGFRMAGVPRFFSFLNCSDQISGGLSSRSSQHELENFILSFIFSEEAQPKRKEVRGTYNIYFTPGRIRDILGKPNNSFWDERKCNNLDKLLVLWLFHGDCLEIQREPSFLWVCIEQSIKNRRMNFILRKSFSNLLVSKWSNLDLLNHPSLEIKKSNWEPNPVNMVVRCLITARNSLFPFF